ncbi:MAG TPA: Gfo/Idh/MocA family oxidoreductase [Chloroflexota bacterium]|nr:Gfo/Idh/MocA family oxidoreductase [Chloroflexota bacterium]
MTIDDTTVGFAVVGAGLVGPRHAAAAAQTAGGRLVAVVDTVEERARTLAEQHGAEWSTDLVAVLARDDVHVVSVCLPTRLHLDIGEQVIAAGKHVVMEKPLELTLDRADRLLAMAREHNVQVAAIFNRRFIPALKATKRAVDEGLMGDILVADMYFKGYRSQEYYEGSGWRGTWAMEGGAALINQGIHGIDLLCWIAGPVARIFGYADHLRRDIEADDTAIGVLRYASGAMGVIQGMTSIQPPLPDRLEFHGTKGSIQLSGYSIARWDVPGAESWPAEVTEEEQALLTQVKNIADIGHILQIADMVGVVREGRAPVVSGDEGRKALEVTLALYDSARDSREVLLAGVPTAS